MNIAFKPSERPTLGVEIEVEIVDEAGALATDTAATKILSELGDEYRQPLAPNGPAGCCNSPGVAAAAATKRARLSCV